MVAPLVTVTVAAAPEAIQFAGAGIGKTSTARGPMSGAPNALQDETPEQETTVALGHTAGWMAETGTDIEIQSVKWPACLGATT